MQPLLQVCRVLPLIPTPLPSLTPPSLVHILQLEQLQRWSAPRTRPERPAVPTLQVCLGAGLLVL